MVSTRKKRLSLRPRDHVVTNKVIRNTYTLLSLTLIFAGVMAYFGLSETRTFGNWLIWLFGALGILALMYPFKDSFIGVLLAFAFTGWDGYWSGPYIRHYLELPEGEKIFMWSAFSTAFLFLILSAYAHISKKDFSYWGGYLCICLCGLCLVTILACFTANSALLLALAFAGVVLFSGYILYDTSRIIHGGETSFVSATIELYLDIIIIFFYFLRIFANFFAIKR